MKLQYQLMVREKGTEAFDRPHDLEAVDMDAAQVDARKVFATARRMAKAGGQTEPLSVRILEQEVEVWRWDWTQENNAPRRREL